MAQPSITSDCEASVTLAGFLMAYGGALVLPLSVIEGPVVSVVAGFVSARGYLDWYWALLLLVCGDLIGDAICYWIGYRGGTPLARLGRTLGLRGGLSPELRRDLRQNAGKMLLIGKWTHSIGCVVLIGSGMLRLPLPRFLLINLFATIPKSAVLLGLGFFVGENFPLIERHVILTTLLLGGLGMAAAAVVLRQTGRLWVGRGAP
jgi:membrane protein DedA with SNARE-associated domain